IYLGQGDYADAALSAVALIPVAGSAAVAVRLAGKGARVIEDASAAERVVADTANVARDLRGAEDGAQAVREVEQATGDASAVATGGRGEPPGGSAGPSGSGTGGGPHGGDSGSPSSPPGKPTPAEQAAAFQGKGAYPGVDAWENTTLPRGTTVHAGEPGVSGFFTSEAAARAVGDDANALNQGLQIAPRSGLYRPGLTEFPVTDDVDAARSINRANPQSGAGGPEQFYIPDWETRLEPVVSRIMHNREAP